MTTLSEPSPASSSERLADLPRLPRDEGGPVFAEPWQAQAFALAVKLSEQGHFTWKEWAAALADELQAAARRGEPDDGSRYYEHWLTALERLVTAKGLADPDRAPRARKEAWADAYRNTPHGQPVELLQSPPKPDARWLLLGLACTFATYWLLQQRGALVGAGSMGGRSSDAIGTCWDSPRVPVWARCSACGTRLSRIILLRCRPS